MMKSAMVIFCVCSALLCFSIPVMAQSNVEDITKEALTGPSDTDPEKILGPGRVGIETGKDILMSFGATVRFIPTSESNWDFGMSENVPGYVNTQPLKAFTKNVLDTAQAVDNIHTASQAFNNSLNKGNASVIAAFDDLSNSLYRAADTEAIQANPTLNNGIADFINNTSLLKNGANQAVQSIAIPISNPIANAAAAAAANAAIQPGADLNSITLASQNAANATATAIINGITNPQQKAIATVSGNAAVQASAAAAASAAGQAASIAFAQAMQGGADQATAAQIAVTAAQAAALTPANNAAFTAASDAATAAIISSNATALVTGANQLTQAVATQIVKDNPNVTMTEALAYATVLKARADSFQPYYLAGKFLTSHSNESGNVNDGYIRNETKMYFNAMPKDKKWSFYAALEFDRPIDTTTVDNRGGKSDDASNFGLERLNASIETIPGLRLHAGWDVWGVDIIEAASMTYGDDNPGFWLTGRYNPLYFSLAWLKLEENDFQINVMDQNNAVDEDRDLFGGYLDYVFSPGNKLRAFYLYDRIRNVPATDLLGAMASEAGLADFAGINGSTPDTDSHNIGLYYLGKFGMFEFMTEGVYKFGKAKETGLLNVDNGVNIIQHDDFDISSYALSADFGLELKDVVRWESFRPHIGFIYTSGDDDSTDDTLGGYSGVTNAQRFSQMWGGENTIIGDTNLALGTALYGYIPEFYGNGTPVFVGGLQNFAGNGGGRGDNPGLTMYSMGLTIRPKLFLIYRTNINLFYWNEDFYVTDMVNPITLNSLATGTKIRSTKIESGFVGTEWDNEITLALSQYMFIKGQFSFFFPGEAVEDVTRALSGGQESDDTAVRIAAELIWNF